MGTYGFPGTPTLRARLPPVAYDHAQAAVQEFHFPIFIPRSQPFNLLPATAPRI